MRAILRGQQQIIKNTLIALPPLAEQDAIVSYLDAACAKIDEAILRHKQIIEKLEEYKNTIISQTVLQGHRYQEIINGHDLSYDTPRIRDCAVFINGDRGKNYPSGADIVDEGIPFVTSDNLWGDEVDIKREKSKFISREKYNSLNGVKLQIDDIVYCLRGSIGKCAINTSLKEGTVASSLTVIRPQHSILPRYLLYMLNSTIVKQQNDNYMNGTCADNLAADSVRNYRIICPNSLEQQQIIVDELDRVSTMVATKQAQHDNIIKKLEEYRKSIIYNAVTGKIKV